MTWSEWYVHLTMKMVKLNKYYRGINPQHLDNCADALARVKSITRDLAVNGIVIHQNGFHIKIPNENLYLKCRISDKAPIIYVDDYA